MAADVPRKKSAAKQAPAKKVAIKKATAKKAVAKKSATKKAPANKVAAKKTASPETVVLAPPAPMEAPEPALAAPADVVESQLATPTTPTFVETLLRLDWRQTAKVAGPSFLVLFAASCVTATSLLLAPTSDQPVGGFGGSGGFFHAVALVAAMAFGSTANVGGSFGGDGSDFSLSSGIGVMPLTITILVLVVYAALSHRFVTNNNGAGSTAGALLRASLVFALLAMGLSFFAHTSLGEPDGHASIGASPAYVFGWALVLTFVVSALVVFAPMWSTALRRDPAKADRVAAWRLPVEGGLAALATSVVIGGVAVIVLLFVNHPDGNPSSSDIARALPLLFALFVNIGVAATGFAMGANVGVTGSVSSDKASIGYAHLHGLSSWYFLWLLLPVVSMGAGALWLLHRRRDEDGRAMWRASYRMAASYSLGWVVLATFSRISVGAVLGGVHVGPQLLVGFGLALGWSLVLGIGYGRLLLTRPDARVRLPIPRLRAPSWQLVSIISGAVIVVITVIDVASGGASASPSESSRSTSIHIATPIPEAPSMPITPLSPPSIAPAPIPVPSINTDFQARGILELAGAKERFYRDQHGTYTKAVPALSIYVPPNVELTIVRADRNHFCMTAQVRPDGQVFSYTDTTAGAVPGDIC